LKRDLWTLTYDVSRLKSVIDDWCNHSSCQWSYKSFLKFRRNVKILRQGANSVAQLEIPRPAENCGP